MGVDYAHPRDFGKRDRDRGDVRERGEGRSAFGDCRRRGGLLCAGLYSPRVL